MLAVGAGCMHMDSEAVADGEQEGAGSFDLAAEFPRYQNPRTLHDWKCDCCLREARSVSGRECPSHLLALLST